MVKILVVEDEVEIAKNLIEILKNKLQNVEVYWAKSVKESRELILKNKPNLVILDINLPDGRGTDINKEYKELYPDGVVIFLTSIDSDIEKIVALELGAEDYITKPFNVNELLAKVKNWVKRISKENREFISIVSDYYFDKVSGMIFLNKEGFFHLVETLSYRESRFFEILLNNFSKVVNWQDIEDFLDVPKDELIVILHGLRRKISKVAGLRILTIKGEGVKLTYL